MNYFIIKLSSPVQYYTINEITCENSIAVRNLTSSVGDLFFAGSETTSTTIRWIFLYMINYPEVQAKIQEEIDQNIPEDELPSLDHKDRKV